jgi:deoxyribose-phosphate aldolase
MENINSYIDATLINPKSSIQEYIVLAENAIKYNLRGLVVPTFALDYIKKIIKGEKLKVSAVIDFPLGLSDTFVRFKEIEYSVNHHANEIDLVINPVFINARKFRSIEDELVTIFEEFHVPVKAIVDWFMIDNVTAKDAIRTISKMIGVSHIKTGTGWYGKVFDKSCKILYRELDQAYKGCWWNYII